MPPIIARESESFGWPWRELGSVVAVIDSPRDCLVALNATPAIVTDLAEVEHLTATDQDVSRRDIETAVIAHGKIGPGTAGVGMAGTIPYWHPSAHWR
ncbi:hypothetical protein [Roseomonas indoligenes]|uniref:Uncharacterized protein n=1 Tax=Roseomonas indoligenes TaxID=2820811 RepID=A0A940S793_9PROT|nr:hypothetical protein [Pararoseomonas indoligenes]MBP0494710.1 hypothetical protein [Pararoseomonas indoligenes]